MDFTTDQVLSFAAFANHGKNVDLEIQSGVFLSVLCPRGTMAYYREYGTDLKKQENRPLTEKTVIELTVQTIDAIGLYNRDVGNFGEERRVAYLSQESDFVLTDRQRGEVAAVVRYVPLRSATSGQPRIEAATI